MNPTLLNDIPDPQEETFDALLGWINGRIAAIRRAAATPAVLKTFASITLDNVPDHPCGVEGSSEWRKFFLATLLADWASYDKPADRADFARLKYVMTSAYPFTRVWGCRLPDGTFAPVGYSAWYPVSKFVFDGILKNPGDVDDRGAILPARFTKAKNIRYAYVFNISIAKELQNTPLSQKMIRALLKDGKEHPDMGLLMITVSPEGRRFSELAGFAKAGKITVQGETETLYARKPKVRPRAK
jgi:hypothetical protein